MHTPEIGRTLVGNCTTVHYGMLDRARELFGPSVQFTIGSISLNGATYFQFTPQELQSWKAGKTKPTYNLHAWLSLPGQGDEIIDLTLAATLNHAPAKILPPTVTFITSVEAAAHRITHNPIISGDDLVFELHLLRGVRVA